MSVRSLCTAIAAVVTFGIGLAWQSAAMAEDTYYTIELLGGPDDEASARLKGFHERLLLELKVSDLGYADVGCVGCDKLNSMPGPTKLTFAMERKSQTLLAFAVSYQFVQSANGHERFQMTINGVMPAAACPDPLPTGCKPRSICIQTSSCDKPYGGACQVCPPT